MTVEELLKRYTIIKNILIDKDVETGQLFGYQSTFILGGEISFDTLEEIDDYCKDAESIIKNLK